MSNHSKKPVHKPQSHKKTPPKSAVSKNSSGRAKIKVPTWIFIAIILTIALVTATVLYLNSTPGKATAEKIPANISVEEAAQRFEAGAFLLDVRTIEEWNEGHIDGAVLIPLNELDARVSEIPTDQDVLIICRSGNRSSSARDILRGYGLNRTTSIMGGMNAWIAAGLPGIITP